MVQEIRKDFFGREVIIAAGRSKRPGAFSKKRDEKQICPFCPGNEHMTEKDILMLPDRKNWQVRVFPNKFPVLDQKDFRLTGSEKFPMNAGKTAMLNPQMYQRFSAFGLHEILVETRDHFKEYEDMELDNLELALVAMKKRYEDLMEKDGINYVTIFKNKGEEAGASIRHTHTQIIASPLFPETISKEMDEAEAFFKEAKKCGHCLILKEEASRKKRIVAQNSHWMCMAPFTAVWPYQLRIIPKRHFSELSEMNYEELKALARILKKVFGKLAGLFPEMPYNMMYHNFPRSEVWHFHMEIIPRLVTHAGLEFFGLNVNIAFPEDAAGALRKSRKK